MRRTPRESDVIDPRARIVPAAHVQTDICTPRLSNRLADGGVARLFIQGQTFAVLRTITTTEINLDEVEAEFIEEEVTVLLVVLVQPHSHGNGIAVVVVAARVMTCIAVNTCLQSLAVDVIDHRLHTVGKTCGMNQQLARRLVASSKVAIIDIDEAVAHIEQTPADHCIGLTLNQFLVDVHTIRVPRAPTHRRTLLCSDCQRKSSHQKQNGVTFHFSFDID